MFNSQILNGSANEARERSPVTYRQVARSRLRVNILGIAVAVLSLLLLSACSTHELYPAAWGPLPAASKQGCRRFAGTYSNSVETSGRRRMEARFTELFFSSGSHYNERIKRIRHSSRVTLAMPTDDVLVVTAWEARDKLFSRRFTSEATQLACQGGHLIITPGAGWVGQTGVAGIITPTVIFMAMDDYLVVRVDWEYFHFLYPLPIPATTEHTRWFRVRRLAD